MFESLHRRPRGRRAALLVDLVKGRSSRDEAWAAVMPPAPADFPFERRTLPPADPPGAVTTGLTSQLDDDQLALLRERLPAEQRSWFEGLDEPDRIKVLTPLALAHDVPGAERATGLSRVMPPPDVHAMSHDDLATGGSLYYGDLVHEALATTGAPLGPGLSVLDFGCSSGRVVRVLETWEPDGQYAGCDPNGPAVRWAAEHLPEIDFRVSAKEPPLEWGDATFDVVYAISVWSHFDEEPALRWLDEMYRVLRPGGRLVFTTQGLGAIRLFVERDGSAANRAGMTDIVQTLYARDFAFFPVFEDTDWGVDAAGWGMAFLTPEWIVRNATPTWHVRSFVPARVEASQDLWVLGKGDSGG